MLSYINEMFKLKINNSKPKDWPQILLIIHNQIVTMNTCYQMWGKTYQCQISNAGGWSIGVRFSKFHDFSMTFDDFFQSSMTFHDFSRKFYFSRFSSFPDPVGTLRIQADNRENLKTLHHLPFVMGNHR